MAQGCLGFPCAEQSCQISDNKSAFISNRSIISPYKKGEVNKDTSNRKKTLDINPFIFLTGSAAVFSEQRWIRARRLVEPRAPEGCCTGRLEQHKEASNSPSGKSPHRSTGDGNAICLLLSRSPLLGAGKKLAHGGGLSAPCCAEVGCRLPGGTCRDQPALLSSFSLFSVVFLLRIPVLFICLLPYDIILQSIPSRQETMESFFLFSLDFILFCALPYLSSSAVPSRGCVIN